MAIDEKKVLDTQVEEWLAEMKRLAGQIAAARGVPSAIVMITPRDEDYANVAPELIAEDALQVYRDGWPNGFDVDILNRSV